MANLLAPLYSLSGKTTKNVTLDASVFGVKPNTSLINQAIRTFLANGRHPVAHTKDRGEVAGGGRKPWRQKGTGNARAGSTRSPLWRGGGVTFGPRSDRNFSLRLPQKMRQGAFRSALSHKAADNHLLIIEDLHSLKGTAKEWVGIAASLPLHNSKTLIIDSQVHDMAKRALRNHRDTTYVSLDGLTILDLIRHTNVIVTSAGLEALTARLQQPVSQKVAA